MERILNPNQKIMPNIAFDTTSIEIEQIKFFPEQIEMFQRHRTRQDIVQMQKECTLEGYNFIDLFAGIGGIRIGFDKLKANCVFSSEWDKFSQITYEANFKKGARLLLSLCHC